MGKQKKKQQIRGYYVSLCPNCGNEIPNRKSGFVCRFCRKYINPAEEEIVKEFRKS